MARTAKAWSVRKMVQRFKEEPPRPREIRDLEDDLDWSHAICKETGSLTPVVYFPFICCHHARARCTNTRPNPVSKSIAEAKISEKLLLTSEECKLEKLGLLGLNFQIYLAAIVDIYHKVTEICGNHHK
jgi:hypothetical protein